MNRLLRLPAIAAVTLVTALFGAATLGGCATDCKEVDGKTVCEAETLTQYRGGTQTLANVAYAPNTSTRLRVTVQGGNVRLGSDAQASITVQRGAPAGFITTACVPIVAMKSDEKAAAEKQMAERVHCTAVAVPDASGATGGEVKIDVYRDGERDSSLTAQLLIGVPDDFSGPVTVLTENGDVSLAGVRGPIDAQITGIGNLGVYPASPILSSDPGRLYVKHGDATLTLPAGSALTIAAVSDDLSAVNNNTGFPAAEGATTIAQNITVNGGGQLWNVRTEFGSILLQAQLPQSPTAPPGVPTAPPDVPAQRGSARRVSFSLRRRRRSRPDRRRAPRRARRRGRRTRTPRSTSDRRGDLRRHVVQRLFLDLVDRVAAVVAGVGIQLVERAITAARQIPDGDRHEIFDRVGRRIARDPVHRTAFRVRGRLRAVEHDAVRVRHAGREPDGQAAGQKQNGRKRERATHEALVPQPRRPASFRPSAGS